MNSVCRTSIVAVSLISAFKSSTAQVSTSKYEVGVHVGTLVYQGDLSKSVIGDLGQMKPAIGLSLTKTLSPYFGVRANLTRGSLSANEANYSAPAWRRLRNFNFSTPVTELSAQLVFNFFGENNGYNYRRLSTYAAAGAGVSLLSINRYWSGYNPIAYDSKSQVQIGLGIDTLRATPRWLPVIPLTFGVRYALTSQWALTGEGTYRFTATDYLDGFKYSGNAARGDSYYGVSIGMSYRFGSYKCPPVKR